MYLLIGPDGWLGLSQDKQHLLGTQSAGVHGSSGGHFSLEDCSSDDVDHRALAKNIHRRYKLHSIEVYVVVVSIADKGLYDQIIGPAKLIALYTRHPNLFSTYARQCCDILGAIVIMDY